MPNQLAMLEHIIFLFDSSEMGSMGSVATFNSTYAKKPADTSTSKHIDENMEGEDENPIVEQIIKRTRKVT